MGSYLCESSCEVCQRSDDERSICMQARIISDICQEEKITFSEGVERYSKAFREKFWDAGIRNHEELSQALRGLNRKVYRIVQHPCDPIRATFFPAGVLESL